MNKLTLAASLLVATSFAFAAPDAARKVVLRGTLSVVQEDDFERDRTARVHSLFDDATGERFTLRSGRLEALRLRTGSRVVVRGMASGRELVVDAEPDAVQVLAAADAPAMDARRAIVIVANFADSAVSCSDAQIAGLMWTGTNSVNGLYQAASFGQVSVPNDVDNNGQPDVIRVNIANTIAETCDAYGWAAAAEAKATEAGINLGLYQHKIIVLPSNITCGWAGLGNVGCSGTCRAWVKTCNLQDVYAHEIGHNLDLAHASTDTNNDGTIDCEYCDKSDIMGYGGVGWRLFSSGHEHQKSWIPPANVQTVTGDGTGTYVLSPLQANPAATPYPQILRIQKPDSGDWYYLSYRQRQGYDASLAAEYVDRANIHRYSGSGYNNTRFLAALQDTQFFDDVPNGMRVLQVSHDASSVTLQITTTCTQALPSVSLSPARQVGAPGQQLSFVATVTNRDALSCGASTFDVSSSVPAGFSSSLTATSLNLAPNASGTITLSTTSPTGAANGDHPVSVTARGVTASAVYAVDANPPTAVALSGALKKTTVNLSWTASTDAGGISAYRVMRNGVQIASTATRSFSEKLPTIAGIYDYTVVAVDGGGMTSAASNAYRITVGGTSGGGGGGKPPRR